MILLIGYGNSLRGDDGAGPVLARMIADSGGRNDLRLITAQQLVPEISLELAAPGVTAAIFMDASVAECHDCADAMLRRIEPDSPASGAWAPVLGHHFPPSALLAYAKFLYGAEVPAWLVTIPGFDFGFGENLSEETEKLLPALKERVVKVLRLLPGEEADSNDFPGS